MSLKETITADVKSAMKEKDQEKLNCLRFLQAAIKNREIDVRPNAITDEDVMSVIKKQVKQRKDSIEQFEKAARSDLADKEKSELAILESYLPKQMDADQLRAIVLEAIKTVGATSMKQMGAVMKEVMQKSQGTADNKLVSEIVKSTLQ